MDIFDHIDYRAYMRDVYLKRKSEGKYTYSQYATELGFQERTFVQHLLAGKRDLSRHAVPRVMDALGLDKTQKAYFLDLFDFATAKDAQVKNQAWERIRNKTKQLRNDVPAASQRLELLEKWYALAIKELLCMGCVEDVDIRRALKRPVSLDEIRRTVSELMRLGFVTQDETGNFIDLEPEISAPTDAEFGVVVRSFQADMVRMSQEALEFTPPEEREFQSLSMSLGPDAFFKVRQILRDTRDRIMEVYEQDPLRNQGVYHVNLTLFPLALPQDLDNNKDPSD